MFLQGDRHESGNRSKTVTCSVSLRSEIRRHFQGKYHTYLSNNMYYLQNVPNLQLLQRLNAAAPVIFGYNPSGGGGPSPPAFVLPPSPSSAYPSNPSLMTSSGPYVLPPPSISLQPAADGAVAPALVSPPSGIRDFSSNPYVPTSSIGRLSFPFLQNPYLSRSLTHMHPLFPSAYDAGDVPYPTHSYPVQSKAEDPVPVPSDPVSMQLALSARERALKKAVDDQLSFGFKSMPKDGAVVKVRYDSRFTCYLLCFDEKASRLKAFLFHSPLGKSRKRSCKK